MTMKDVWMYKYYNMALILACCPFKVYVYVAIIELSNLIIMQLLIIITKLQFWDLALSALADGVHAK